MDRCLLKTAVAEHADTLGCMHHIDTLNGYMVNDRSLIKLLVCTRGARIEDIGTKVINCNKLQTADGSDGFFSR